MSPASFLPEHTAPFSTFADRAWQQALNVAHRLRANDIPHEPASIHTGHPGPAILFTRLSAVDLRWQHDAHTHLTAAARKAHHSATCGVRSGPGAVLAAATYLARTSGNLPLYRPFLTAGLPRLAAYTHHLVANHDRLKPASRQTIGELTGTTRVLLTASEVTDIPEHQQLARNTATAAAVALTGHLRAATSRWLPATTRVDVGMANGLAGVVSCLAWACRHRIEVPGLHRTLRTGARWLTAYTTVRAVPAEVSADTAHPGRQYGWCHGLPGIAFAIHTAGRLLQDTTLTRAAVQALCALPPTAWDDMTASVCHGTAGLLQILTRIRHTDPEAGVAAVADAAAAHCLQQANPASRFLYGSPWLDCRGGSRAD